MSGVLKKPEGCFTENPSVNITLNTKYASHSDRSSLIFFFYFLYQPPQYLVGFFCAVITRKPLNIHAFAKKKTEGIKVCIAVGMIICMESATSWACSPVGPSAMLFNTCLPLRHKS